MFYSTETISEEQVIHAFSLRSLRIICVFAVLVNLFYVFYGLGVQVEAISIICAIYTIGGISAYIASYFSESLAKVLVITSTAVSLMVTFHTFTIGYSILTIFFPIVLAHLFIFNFDVDKKPFFVSLSLTAITLVLSLVSPRFQFLKVILSEEIASQTDQVHAAVSLAVTTFLLVVIIQSRTKLNRLLFLQKKDLENAIAELHETRDQLIQTEKMASLGLLTAGINHEINNPLNFMAGGLENLKKLAEERKDEEIGEYLYVFEEGIRRIEDIVSGLNHFNYRSTSFDDHCDIKKIIENCLKILSHELKDRVAINQSFQGNLTVKGNSGQLHQVFMNLLANAAQAIDGAGFININAARLEDRVSIEILDSGCGIPDEIVRNIFDPFFTTKEPGIGTGLGLSVSYSIIKKHAGEINVRSEEGKGTTFAISLPLAIS